MRPGSIVSLHLGHPGTVEALPAVLAHLHDRGLAPVTASELLGELGGQLQAKLLRALETTTFRRVGGTRDLTADVRIIAATNRNLDEEVRAGRFRLDLFHRLDVFHLTLPPLRDRHEDIPGLAQWLLERIAQPRPPAVARC